MVPMRALMNANTDDADTMVGVGIAGTEGTHDTVAAARGLGISIPTRMNIPLALRAQLQMARNTGRSHFAWTVTRERVPVGAHAQCPTPGATRWRM